MGVTFIQPGRFGVAFDPLSFDLAAMYDASDAGSITSSGGAVSQWNDLSSAARHQAQSNATYKPTTGADSQNGLNVIQFGNLDYMLYDAGSDTIDVSPMTFFIVAKFSSTANSYDRPLSARRSASGSADYQAPNFCVARQASDAIDWNSNGTAIGVTKAYTDNTMFIYYGRNNGSTSYHSINGGSVSSVAASSPANMRYLAIGAEILDGAPPTLPGPNSGNITVGQIAVIHQDLSAGDIADWLSYLNTKWAVY